MKIEDNIFSLTKNMVNISQSSSNYGKLHFVNDLLVDVNKINVDDASKVKIKIWLESHKKIIKDTIRQHETIEDPFLDSI